MLGHPRRQGLTEERVELSGIADQARRRVRGAPSQTMGGEIGGDDAVADEEEEGETRTATMRRGREK